MSTKRKQSQPKDAQPRSGKAERYIQPSLLLGLKIKSSYGYELINNIHEFGFVQGQAPPGMIYRHLRAGGGRSGPFKMADGRHRASQAYVSSDAGRG